MNFSRFSGGVLLVIGCLFSLPTLALGLRSEQFTLDNGMEVVVIENSKVAAVSHMVWYQVGAMDEMPGKSGIAHFLEHLMFKGTPTYGPGQFSKLIAKAGGNDNAFTGKDFTGYYQNVARDRLELVMELESDRMKNLLFAPDEVEKERDVVLEERRARTDNSPTALMAEQMNAALFLNHPFGRPVVGWEHEIAGFSLEDAKAFYNRHYAPNNAFLIVSGDITTEELKPLAEKYYGHIPRQMLPERINPTEPQPIAPRFVRLSDPKVVTPQWSRYYLAPGYNKNTEIQCFALTLLSRILGDSDTSRLYQELVVNQNLAASVGSDYNDLTVGPSAFVLYAVPTGDHTLEQIEAALDAEIARIVSLGVTNDELIRAKKALIADTIYAQEDLKTLSYIYGHAMVTSAGVHYVENWQHSIEAVTAEQIKAAAADILKPERSVTGYLVQEKP